jgi:hypothetical protein
VSFTPLLKLKPNCTKKDIYIFQKSLITVVPKQLSGRTLKTKSYDQGFKSVPEERKALKMYLLIAVFVTVLELLSEIGIPYQWRPLESKNILYLLRSIEIEIFKQDIFSSS